MKDTKHIVEAVEPYAPQLKASVQDAQPDKDVLATDNIQVIYQKLHQPSADSQRASNKEGDTPNQQEMSQLDNLQPVASAESSNQNRSPPLRESNGRRSRDERSSFKKVRIDLLPARPNNAERKGLHQKIVTGVENAAAKMELREAKGLPEGSRAERIKSKQRRRSSKQSSNKGSLGARTGAPQSTPNLQAQIDRNATNSNVDNQLKPL